MSMISERDSNLQTNITKKTFIPQGIGNRRSSFRTNAKSRPKRVSFDPVIQIQHLDNKSSWINDKEAQKLMTQWKMDVMQMEISDHQTKHRNMDTPCFRGLERWVTPQHHQRCVLRRSMVVRSVLREQAEQRKKLRYDNYQRLSTTISSSSSFSSYSSSSTSSSSTSSSSTVSSSEIAYDGDLLIANASKIWSRRDVKRARKLGEAYAYELLQEVLKDQKLLHPERQ